MQNRFFAMILLGCLSLCSCKRNPYSAIPPAPETPISQKVINRPSLPIIEKVIVVPDKMPMHFNIFAVKGVDITKNQVWKRSIWSAFKLILSKEDSVLLQGASDKWTMNYIRKLMTNTPLVIKILPTSKEFQGRMGYSCPANKFAINKGLHATVPWLAVTLYHELRHTYDCKKEMAKRKYRFHSQMTGVKIFGNKCQSEKPAYTAQVRLFVAFHKSGLFPRNITISDAGILNQSVTAWKALHGNKFCSWFKRMKNNKQMSILKQVPSQ